MFNGLENEEWLRAYRITDETESRVMKEQRSQSRIAICTWPAVGDKYSREDLNRVVAE